jgi:preprotein translocase subunit SecY
VSIIFNPQEVADNMRKYGGFVPGIHDSITIRALRCSASAGRCTA